MVYRFRFFNGIPIVWELLRRRGLHYTMKTHRFSIVVLCFLLLGVGWAYAASEAFEVEELGVRCATDLEGAYQAHLLVTNRSGEQLPGIVLRLVSGADTIEPGVFLFASPLADGEAKSIQVELKGASALSTVTIELGFLGEDGAVTATKRESLVLPECDCLEVVSQKLECVDERTGLVRLTATVHNRASFDMNHLILLPLAGGAETQPEHFEVGIAVGAREEVVFEFTAGDVPTILLSLSGHDEALDQCCSTLLSLPNPCRRSLTPCPVLTVAGATERRLALSISDPKVPEPLVVVEASLTLEPDSWRRVPFALTPDGPVIHHALQGQGTVYVSRLRAPTGFYRVVTVSP